MPPSSPPTRVLVIDDEAQIRDLLRAVLEGDGHEVELAEDGEIGMEKLDATEFDLVITDLRMPRAGGMEILGHLQKQGSKTLAMVATGFGSVEGAVSALRAGAYDYITKPFHPDEIKKRVRNALEYKTLRNENQNLRKQLISSGAIDNLIGESAVMLSLRQMIRMVADSDSTILILGESGTGKELVAKAIHYHSTRADRSLIPVNCAAIPEDLLESELFGHVKGAFTGAASSRVGRFELADRGTIFLDEIGDMSPKLQVKILRVLQEQEFEPVGSAKTLKVDVRVIAATNRRLDAEVSAGRFRKDLFYRLNVVHLEIPPLRKRKEDLPALVDHVVAKLGVKVSREALYMLIRHEWPGNVRELENVLQCAAAMAGRGGIRPADLPPMDGTQVAPGKGASLRDMEMGEIRRLLEEHAGETGTVAGILGIDRSTLYRKIKRYQIDITKFRRDKS